MNAGSTFYFLYVGLQYVSLYVYMSDDLMFSLCYGHGVRLSAASKVGKKIFFFPLFAERLLFLRGGFVWDLDQKQKRVFLSKAFKGGFLSSGVLCPLLLTFAMLPASSREMEGDWLSTWVGTS